MGDSIEPYVHRKVVVLNEDDSVENASRAMCQHEIGCIVIGSADNGEIAGIITDRDLVCFVLACGLSTDVKLHQIMTRRPITVDSMASVDDVIQIMKENGIRRVPIVETSKNGGQHCIGVITLDDLMIAARVSPDDISTIIKAQIRIRERQTPDRLGAVERREQTYSEFIKKIGEELELKEKGTEEFIRFVLGSIVMRMQITTAAHFLAQLPHRLQQEMAPMMVGPDRSVTAESIRKGVMSRFTRNDYEAVAIIRTFWSALSRHMSGSASGRALNQLPRDVQQLLRDDKLGINPEPQP